MKHCRSTLLLCLLLLASGLSAKTGDGNNTSTPAPNWRTFNIGIKAGFNSSMFLVSRFKIQDVTIKNFQNNYKLGYYGSIFMRYNWRRNYFQPEISYNISKSEISFDKLGSHHPDIEPDYATLTSVIHSFDMPLLYGYHIVKQGPYGMALFGGPKIRYIWGKKNKITFVNFDLNNIQEELYPLNLSITVGVAVNISRIFFDFRYEQDVSNISRSVTYESNQSDGSAALGLIKLKRREQTISFSLGVLF